MIRRQAMRAVLLTPGGRILLMRCEDPASGRNVWFTPGGAVEPGETSEAGLRRELAEETGLRDVQVGPLLWTRTHEFSWDGRSTSARSSAS